MCSYQRNSRKTQAQNMMDARIRCYWDLEDMRLTLHNFNCVVIPDLIADLKNYADELDAAYKGIKISKVAGQSAGVVGGVLSVVGFGLSFATFGASLGLVLAGGVIGGLGGTVSGGASVTDFVQAKKARDKTKQKLIIYEKASSLVLEKCINISDKLEHFGVIDKVFPKWFRFWVTIVFGSGSVLASVGWRMVANTVRTAIRIGKGIDLATDVTSASIPVFRTLGTATSRGLHITGGVVSSIFLPVDVGLLIYDSSQLYKKKAHADSKRIREIVTEIQKKCRTEKQIDDMTDDCILALFN